MQMHREEHEYFECFKTLVKIRRFFEAFHKLVGKTTSFLSECNSMLKSSLQWCICSIHNKRK